MGERIPVTFLLGAGASSDFGYPLTWELTDKILGIYKKAPSNYIRYPNGSYSPRSTPPPDEDFSPQLAKLIIIPFLNILKSLINGFNTEPNPVNILYGIDRKRATYEDLYYVLEQMHNENIGHRQDIAANVLKSSLIPIIRGLIVDTCHCDDLSYWLKDPGKIIEESLNYIECVLREELKPRQNKQGDKFNPASIFLDACRDSRVIIQAIGTLNHDNHLEKILEQEGDLNIADGFNDHRLWDFTNPHFPEGSLPFIKLHGSIDWFAEGYTLKKRVDDEIMEENSTPVFLIGTFNKEENYSRHIFLDLIHKFRQSLYQSQLLVIIGYGFGDQGINSMIIDWMHHTSSSQVLVVNHKSCDYVVSNARVAIKRLSKYLDDCDSKRSFLIRKKYRNLRWNDIQEHLGQLRKPQ